MYILDTDHLSLLERQTSMEAQRLHFRLLSLKPEEIATTIITFEEQMRGWMALLSRARSLEKQIEVYRWLNNSLDRYRKMEVLAFDGKAGGEFARLKQQRIRLGTMDLKIAAIALAHQATLLSRNLRDYERISGLKVEDWSA
ncbi:MAG: type II toxin-antitoxin system VapC family toxin [Blastocatellia bacterium]